MIYAVIVLVLLAILLVGLYNKLAKQRVVVDEASSDIETFLKQRYDMIPNLVEIVKGYAKHETETFTKVTELRAKAMSAGSLEQKMEIEGELSKAVTKVMAVAENYPELKANANFLDLQTNLKELEDNIQKSRRYYNGAARDFNSMLVVFPNNLLAGIFGFKNVAFFEATEEEKKNVEIKF
ncbi:MAG: LemA family protein [Candidatus Dojkabacteria bacterium]|jgi:LemA protein|nr:LemA family protein [Candidatus Dojkabacteria bacterium]MDD4561192.1 LemA family protein [Candidatus Dojkabacteria bacterium]NLB12097.1 LemA family protein [Candidatus Dojkabacteria bacterium]